jgi:flagellar protein FliO/FliZ
MNLFSGMSFPVQFFLAFVIVLALIGATAWAVRRFGSGRLGGVGLRGRQPRLAVIDYASVDGRRRLILVRRDNVEHLLMIGGPTDVVVESNIVRAAPASRDVAMPRGPTMETPPRAIPLPDNTTNGNWPLQPEPASASAPARTPRGEHATDEPAAWQPHAEAAARAPRESLAALADELAPRPPAPQRTRPQPSARPAAAEPRPEPRPEPRQPIKAEPRMAAPQPAAAAAEPGPSIDQSLAEMAHKLEAALRKPKAERAAAAPNAAAAPGEASASAEAKTVTATPAAAPAARANRAAEAKPAGTETKQPNPGKALYDSLEQEMASLLGRPAAKN